MDPNAIDLRSGLCEISISFLETPSNSKFENVNSDRSFVDPKVVDLRS